MELALSELQREGFKPAESKEGTEEGVVLYRRGPILAALRRVTEEGDVYRLVRAGDSTQRVIEGGELDRLEQSGHWNNLNDLLPGLENPNWLGVSRKTREAIYAIARTPPTQKIEDLLRETLERICEDYQEPLKTRLEIYFDAAATAYATGNPEFFRI